MKFIIATIVCLIVSVSALRKFDSSEIDFNDEHSVSSYFKNTMQDVSESIKAADWDPFYIRKKEINFGLPVPIIYNSLYVLEDFMSNGLSNIVLNKASYNVTSSSLSFDIEMPLIDVSLGIGSVETTWFGTTFKMSASGRVMIQYVRFVGQIGFNVNLPAGITVSSSNVIFSLVGIEPDVHVKIQDDDYSDIINKSIFLDIPAKLKEYSNEINELFGILSKKYINQYLQGQEFKF